MKKNTVTALVRAGEDNVPALFRSSDERDDLFLTPREAADYLRVSKSYLDKLRVYGGGPKFLRFGKRKILYRKSDLSLWAIERCFGSTSEYEAPSQENSNNRKQHPLPDTVTT
jgi:excisionase family DNA binding protein